MCTGVVDIQPSIPAVKVSNLIHQEIPVKLPGGALVTCQGGINAKKVTEFFQGYLPDYFMYNYLDALPSDYHRFNMTCVNKSFVELRYM